jgi:8-oxo-dGTP diphosphatase
VIRRYGEAIRPGLRYRQRPGVYAILQHGPHVLLTYQAGLHHEFQLPGGGIDPGESPLQALHREVHEETGWRIARPRRIGAHRRFAFMPDYDLWAEKIAHVYLAYPTRPLGPPTEPEHSAVWVPLPEAPALLASAGDATFVASLL